MPKRSNDFQKLVFLVKKHVAAGATVTESKFLRDRITGKNREVDVCIESTVGGHEILVSIECRDRGRPADVGWVEEMKTKHERLPTDRIVLFSKSGFTKEAIEVARIYGIEALALQAVNKESVERLFGDTGSLWAKTFTLTPTKVVIGVGKTGDLPEENVVAVQDNIIYTAQGDEIGPIKQLVETLLHTENIGKEFGRMGDASHKGFEVRWEDPKDNAGNPLCLQKLEPKTLRPISFIRITGTCNFEVSEFPLKQGALGNIRVAWSTGSFFGEKALLVASEDLSGGNKLTISTKNITISRLCKQK